MKKLFCLGMIVLSLALSGSFGVASAAEQEAAVHLININTATLAELETIPGIGPVSAQRIIDYRTEHGSFSSVDQLVEIKGIGEKSVEKIKPLVTTN